MCQGAVIAGGRGHAVRYVATTRFSHLPFLPSLQHERRAHSLSPAQEGGRPLVYESVDAREALGSGWVAYVAGSGRASAQGFVRMRAGVRPTGGRPGGKEVRELSTRWIERLQESTEEMISDAVGHIRDVQAALVYGASQGWALEDIPSHEIPATLTKGAMSGPQLMLRSVCSGADPQISAMYAELGQIVEDQGGNMGDFLHEKEGNDDNRPKAFFLVAIDIPGYGACQPTAVC